MDKTRTMRQASLDDAPKVARFINKTRPPSQIPIACRKTNTETVRNLQRQGQFLLVDHVDGPLAGAIYVTTQTECGYLDLLSVSVSMADEGLDRRLLTIAEMMCRSNSCKRMEIRVAKEEITSVFHDLGYRFYRNDIAHDSAIRMRKELTPILH